MAVIKTLTRKDDSFEQAIRYVLSDYIIEPPKPEKIPYWKYYVPGVRMTRQDLENLYKEKGSVKELKELYAFLKHGTLEEFIQLQMLQSPNAKYKDGQKRRLNPIVIAKNLRGNTIGEFAKSYKDNEQLRQNPRKGAVTMYHHIISFSNIDTPNIDEKILRDTVQKFISLRSEKSIFLSAVHVETNAIHAHVLQSGIEFKTGLSTRVSKADFQALKNELTEYLQTRYPEQLKHSQPQHGRLAGRGNTPEMPYKSNARTTKVNSLLEVLESSHKESKSLEDFFSRISAAGHEVYFRNGRPQGVKYNGAIKFRFSRLNFEQNLSELQQRKERTDKGLQELQAIRTGGRKSRIVEIDGAQPIQAAPTVQERLASLDADARRSVEQQMLNANRAFEEIQNEGRVLDDQPSHTTGKDATMPNAKERLQELADLRNRHSQEPEREYEEDTHPVPSDEDDTGKDKAEDEPDGEPEDEEDTTINDDTDEDCIT